MPPSAVSHLNNCARSFRLEIDGFGVGIDGIASVAEVVEVDTVLVLF